MIVIRAQVAMEFLMVFGFVMAVTIPMIILNYDFQKKGSDEVRMQQLSQLMRAIVDNAEKVYAGGTGTVISFKAYVPGGVKSTAIGVPVIPTDPTDPPDPDYAKKKNRNREVIFTITTTNGDVEVVQNSPVILFSCYSSPKPPFPGTPGVYRIKLIAQRYEEDNNCLTMVCDISEDCDNDGCSEEDEACEIAAVKVEYE